MNPETRRMPASLGNGGQSGDIGKLLSFVLDFTELLRFNC